MRLAALLLVGLLETGCGTQPCSGTACPELEGGYVATWERSALSTCPGNGPRPAVLNFSRTGSLGQLSIDDAQLKGSVYDTWDFSLHGSSASGTYALRGRASQPKAGGKYRLTGTLTIQKDSCELVERYTADQT